MAHDERGVEIMDQASSQTTMEQSWPRVGSVPWTRVESRNSFTKLIDIERNDVFCDFSISLTPPNL